MADEVDHWGLWQAQHGFIQVLDQPAVAQVATQAMSCGGCGQVHVVLDIYAGRINTRLAITPDDALELAAKIVAEVKRVCGAGAMN